MAEVKYLDKTGLEEYDGLIKGVISTGLAGKSDTNHTHDVATTTAAGFMSADDKTKLDGITAGGEPNQNAFANVKVGTVTVAADAKQDTLTIANGDGISVVGDATNDKVTITNSGVRSIAPGSDNGTISVNTGGTSANVKVKGLGSAAYAATTAFDAAGTAQTKADAALASAKTYADNAAAGVKNDLLNGAGEAYDTLKELGDLIDTNTDAIDALNTVAAGKANSSDLTSHTGNTAVHITADERTNWNAAKTHADKKGSGTVSNTNPHGLTPSDIGAAASSHSHNDLYYTEGEIDSKITALNTAISGKANSSHTHTIANVTNLQSALDGKAASSHSHTSGDVTAMTGYTKATASAAIAATDSLNTAIGKLEKGFDSTAAVALANQTNIATLSGYLPEQKQIKTITTAEIQALFA